MENVGYRGLEWKLIDQRYDGWEAWVRQDQSDWIRLDFVLEYYLFGNVDVTKEFAGQLGDEKKVKKYCDLLCDKFTQAISDGYEFDFQKYSDWQQRKGNIDEARRFLRLKN
jgi:hypothetical protein